MEIREYRPEDCREMAALFSDTVHEVNAADYTKEQLDAWAGGKVDTAAWNRSFLEHDTFVAEENGVIVGFADMDAAGYRVMKEQQVVRKGVKLTNYVMKKIFD